MKRFVSLAANLAAKSKAWASVAMLLMGLNAFLVIIMASMSLNQPTRLVPCGFDQADGPVTVTNSGKGGSQYNAIMAQGDIKLLTDWSPSRVKDRYGRLLNRMTPKMYAATSSRIISDAERLSQSAASQVLLIDSVLTNDVNQVEVRGTLRIWEGQEKMTDEQRNYRITYEYIGDMPMIDAIEDVTNKPGGGA